MFTRAWNLIKDTVSGFSTHEAMSHAAAIAYFTIFSLAPLLLIVISIAGLVFGREAAQAAIMGQFSGLMGKGSGDALASMLQSAGSQSQKSGTIATIVGVVTLLITASGAFGEIQSSLNKIWKAEPKAGLTRLVRARIASMGLGMTLGFLLVVSLAVSAGLAALGHWVEGFFPGAKVLMAVVNVAESYGTAGSLIVILLWIYYSTVTFLLGAEFTRAYTECFGSHAEHRAAEAERVAPRRPQPAPEPRPAFAASPDALARRTASTRAEIDQTWRVIRERVPEPPALPPKIAGRVVAERPSWLQIAVAGLAVVVLPMPRRSETAATWRVARDGERMPATEAMVTRPTQPVPAE